MLVMLAAYECRKLRNGEAISVRKHSCFVKLVSLAAMIMFIIVETLISNNSDTAIVTTRKEQDCVSIKSGMVSADDPSAGEAITFKCMSIINDIYSFRTGNYSKADGTVECGEDVIYTYEASSMLIDEPVVNCTVRCASPNCVAVKYDGNRLLISQPFGESSLEDLESSVSSFIQANVSSGPRPRIEEIADKVMELFMVPIINDLEILRRILLHAYDRKCEFVDKRKEVTKISTWITVIVIIVWTLSILLCFISLAVRKHVFYDLCQAWDWAAKAHNIPERATTRDLYVKCKTEEDCERIYVTGSPEELNERLNQV